MAFTIKGLPPGSHTNAALPENELDAELFNEYESILVGIDDNIIKMLGFIVSMATSLQFTVDTGSTTSGTPIPVIVGQTTGTGEVIPFPVPGVTSLDVEIISDTGGLAQIDGGTIPVTVAISPTTGLGTLSLTSSVPSVVTLGIVSPHPSGLDTSDQFVGTFS